eukprot:690953-Pelagomonas_calceolata.AAC.5
MSSRQADSTSTLGRSPVAMQELKASFLRQVRHLHNFVHQQGIMSCKEIAALQREFCSTSIKSMSMPHSLLKLLAKCLNLHVQGWPPTWLSPADILLEFITEEFAHFCTSFSTSTPFLYSIQYFNTSFLYFTQSLQSKAFKSVTYDLVALVVNCQLTTPWKFEHSEKEPSLAPA